MMRIIEMICYKDMTFCIADCANKKCHIKYTDQVVKDAAKWWGNGNAPIAIADRSKGCSEFKPRKEKAHA
jgi:hypothetical protein